MDIRKPRCAFRKKGIGHQVAAEVGYAVPGALVVHFDPHISQLGTFGTLALGIHQNMLEAYSPSVLRFACRVRFVSTSAAGGDRACGDTFVTCKVRYPCANPAGSPDRILHDEIGHCDARREGVMKTAEKSLRRLVDKWLGGAPGGSRA
ncbi:aconitase family protein [Paraburkholderia sp. CNPSo 3274]|uniref:aconitase family protein n=1 Tax=Paraburkholderia sp. CNPSo 3274 TaxID=2940932 RepID=UPI0035CCD9C8